MNKTEIFQMLKANVLNVMNGLDGTKVTESASLRELGANSIDRPEIIMMTLQDMNVRASMVDFAQAKNISELCELLEAKLAA